MGMEGEALLTEEPPPSFAESWRMVWKVESLRRIFYALPFLAASLIGFASLAALLYQQEFGLDTVHRGLHRGHHRAGAARRPGHRRPLRHQADHARPGADHALPGRRRRSCAAAFAAVFALAPWLWLTVVANMAIAATLAIVGPGVFAALSLGIPPRARSMGFSLGAIWVIPGLIVLPIVGAVSDGIGIRPGMLIMTPVFVVGGLILAGSGRVLNEDIKQVWTMAAARSEVLYERRQGRVKLLLCRGLQVYYGNVQVLFDVDFEVDEGEIVALLGTNGAGKSTLLKAICGVVEADKGAVIFDGRDITHAPPNEIAALGVSQVPGGQGVFPSLTVPRTCGWPAGSSATATTELGDAHGDRVLDLFPVLASRHRRAGRQPVRRPAADAGARHGVPGPAAAAADRRALARLAPVVVEQLLPDGRGHPRAGHHGDPGRAVGEPGPDHRRDRLLHGEGRDPLPRSDRRAARTARHAALGVPRRGRVGAAGRAPSAEPAPTALPPGDGMHGTAGRRPVRPTSASPTGPLAAALEVVGGPGAVRRHPGGGRRVAAGRPGRDRRHHRAERRRQDHAVRPHLRLHPGRRRPGAARRARRSPGAAPTSGPGSASAARSRTRGCSRR